MVAVLTSKQDRIGRRALNKRQNKSRPVTNTNYEEDTPYYGDLPGPVRPGEMRIGSINIDNLPFTNDDSYRNHTEESHDAKNE